jgi:hypothetical protein
MLSRTMSAPQIQIRRYGTSVVSPPPCRSRLAVILHPAHTVILPHHSHSLEEHTAETADYTTIVVDMMGREVRCCHLCCVCMCSLFSGFAPWQLHRLPSSGYADDSTLRLIWCTGLPGSCCAKTAIRSGSIGAASATIYYRGLGITRFRA